MKIRNLHPWTTNPKQAVELQNLLRKNIKLVWDEREVSKVAGVDISIKGNYGRAAIVILEYPTMIPLDHATEDTTLDFPYIPGLLTFREGPAILAAWENLSTLPDLILFDGHGIAHPRGIGIASQMGLWLEIPTVGVAKSRLFGQHSLPGPNRGEQAPLYNEFHQDQIIGMVLRTRSEVKPVYVSPGDLIDVKNAVKYSLRCCKGYRLPEPIRWAHQIAGGDQFPKS